MARVCPSCKNIRINPLSDDDFETSTSRVCNLCKSVSKRVNEKWNLIGKKEVRKSPPFGPADDPSDYFKNKQDFRDLLLRLWLVVPNGNHCYYTGIPMKIKTSDGKLSWSVDRMDSDKPYSPNNIVICVNFVNIIKRTLDSDAFSSLGVSITRQHIQQGTPGTIEKIIKELINNPDFPDVRNRLKAYLS